MGIVKRSLGHSSVAAAAYCSGTKIKDERTNTVHDFAQKTGVVRSEVFLSTEAPNWMYDRKTLWNCVERIEKRKDAQVARIIDIALPVELTVDQNWQLLKSFVRSVFVDKGMAADVNIHNDNSSNPHAHILLTLRRITADGFEQHKARDWNKTDFLLSCRKVWAEQCNQYLELHKHDVRIDHRSHATRGVQREPTIHMGRAYNAFKYSKQVLDRVEQNQAILSRNALLAVNVTSRGLRNFGFFSNAFELDRGVDDNSETQIDFSPN